MRVRYRLSPYWPGNAVHASDFTAIPSRLKTRENKPGQYGYLQQNIQMLLLPRKANIEIESRFLISENFLTPHSCLVDSGDSFSKFVH